jgi:hypothetical protein
MGLDVVFPQSIQRYPPPIDQARPAATETSLIADPTDGIQTATQRLLEEWIAPDQSSK